MADIINAPDLPSEDEEDDDYDPSRQGDLLKTCLQRPQILCRYMHLSHHVPCRDADKGDEPKAKSKSGPKGRNKRPLEVDEEMCEDEEADAQPRATSSKTIAKKAKVWPAMPLPPRHAPSGRPCYHSTRQGFKDDPALIATIPKV